MNRRRRFKAKRRRALLARNRRCHDCGQITTKRGRGFCKNPNCIPF